MCHGEDASEIKIVREHDEPPFLGESHDFRVKSFRIADF